MNLTKEKLREFAPNAAPWIIDGILEYQDDLETMGDITTLLRLQHFMTQITHETGGLVRLEENLNYTAKRMTQVWPSRFKTLASAQPFAKNPELLANKVYNGRLGNKKPGDGWKYRGSGLIQTTGLYNFAQVQDATSLPVVAQPELLRTFPGALQAAAVYWKKRGVNVEADQDDLTGVRKLVNGGTIGLDDCRVYLKKAKKVFDNRALLKGVPDRPSLNRRVLKRGDKGEDVKQLQEELNKNGFALEVDGIFGKDTQRDLNLFKANAGLAADGVADDKLYAALEKAR